MKSFDSLTSALNDWFDKQLCDLPDSVCQRVEQDFFPIPWDNLSADQRRSVALQLDHQHDPATEQHRKFWWDFFLRADDLKKQIAEWDAVTTPTASELAKKELRLAELKRDLARMEAQKMAARGDCHPERRPCPTKQKESHTEPATAVRYIAYPKAMQQLARRLGASPEELAAWIWLGPKDDGIAAYVNANELDPPPRFFYAAGGDSHDYIAPLMACWFKVDDIDHFEPADRYITGAALLERWGQRPGLQALAFIQAKIAESRLLDIHPIYGGTRGTFSEHSDWPPVESGLFPLAHVVQIEAEDFDTDFEAADSERTEIVESVAQPDQTVVGSARWRSTNAQNAANALHDKPGGSREKQRQIRAIWATGKYSSRDLCAEQECAALNMSFSAARRALNKTPEPSRC